MVVADEYPVENQRLRRRVYELTARRIEAANHVRCFWRDVVAGVVGLKCTATTVWLTSALKLASPSSKCLGNGTEVVFAVVVNRNNNSSCRRQLSAMPPAIGIGMC